MDGSKVQTNDISQAIATAIGWLDRAQAPDGYWVGAVETNVAMEAEWLLTSHFLGIPVPGEDKVIAGILARQRPDGAWEVYPSAPKGDLNGTVEAYAALRAKGFGPDHPAMVKARDWILKEGGLRNVRVFTRYWLAMIGVWPWAATPNLPPEVIRLPFSIPFNIYHFAQWARATIVPLCVVSARQPVWPLPGGDQLDELFPEGYENFDFFVPATSRPCSLEWAFRTTRPRAAFRPAQELMPLRENTIKLCLEWLIQHQDADGAWGGIQPPWIYGLHRACSAKATTSNTRSSPRGLAALDDALELRARWRHASSRPPNSLVWDTMICLLAEVEAGHDIVGHAEHPQGAGLYPRSPDSGRWRLVDAHGQGHRARRLGLRARQYPLSGCGRHRVWPAVLATIRGHIGDLRPRVETSRSSGRSAGFSACRAPTAAGGVRSRQ